MVAYGNEAADGRVSDPAAACYPVAVHERLEVENLLLRQQLAVLLRKSPTRARRWNIDRLLLVWLYRLYPSLLDAIIIGYGRAGGTTTGSPRPASRPL